MTTLPTTDPKPTAQPKTKPLDRFPDMGSLIAAMDRARADGDEALRAHYNPIYERSHAYSDGWGTHIPLLASVIATAKRGPVLEIGVGRCSSPLVVEMCRAMDRDLVGIDADQNWLDEIATLGYPELHCMPDWSALESFLGAGRKWAVIFIDHGPGEARLPVLQTVHKHADVESIVCHDTFNPGYLVGFDAELDTFRYRYDYLLMPSCTSVVSDVKRYAGSP